MLIYVLLSQVTLLLLTLIWSLLRTPIADQELIRQNNNLQEINRELLNRLQAPDVRTFQALTASSNLLRSEEETPYISRDDEAEARIVNGGDQAFSYLSDEQVKMYNMDTFGLTIQHENS